MTKNLSPWAFFQVMVLFLICLVMMIVVSRHVSSLKSEISALKIKFDGEISSIRFNSRMNDALTSLNTELINQVEEINKNHSAKIRLLEESIDPSASRWAKIKIVRAAVKKTYEEHTIPAKLDTRGVTSYASAVVDYSEQYDVPISLILAVTRQESAFNPGATSHAGARGLMQVMPSTAVEIAGELGVRHYSLYSVKDSVRFGTYYLMKMLDLFDKYDSKYLLAVAAYNCGPTYTLKYVGNEYSKLPAETTNYVERILGNEFEKGFFDYYKSMGL